MSQYYFNSTQVAIVATLVAKEGKRQALLDALYPLMQAVPREPGCIRYELNQSLECENTFVFVERYANQQAVDEHVADPEGQKTFELISAELVDSIDVKLLKPINI